MHTVGVALTSVRRSRYPIPSGKYISTPNAGYFKCKTAHTNTNRTKDSRPSKTSTARKPTKEQCALNRLNPVSPQRLYKSIWEIFRIKTHKHSDRRVLQGIQLIKEDAAP